MGHTPISQDVHILASECGQARFVSECALMHIGDELAAHRHQLDDDVVGHDGQQLSFV